MKNSEAKKEVNEDIKVISLNEYHEMKPKSFEPNSVLNFLTFYKCGQRLDLKFSASKTIGLSVNSLKITAKDMGESWPTTQRPKHEEAT